MLPKELLELARSSQLREDMRRLRKTQVEAAHTVDDYIQFLHEMHAMVTHTPKTFRKISGEFFLL